VAATTISSVIAAPAEERLVELAAELGAALAQRAWQLATAESSTGGLVGHVVTAVPGASRYYQGGVICYSNRAKEIELGVPGVLIERHGAVSHEVAAAMASGVLERFGADLALAITGIAGPNGAAPQKPVGLHFVAAAVRGREPVVERHVFDYDRAGNRLAAAAAALALGLAEVSVRPP
jgi:PncC family amidohydrolase